MTLDINNFAILSRYNEGDIVTFGDDSKVLTLKKDKLSNSSSIDRNNV